MNPLSLITGAVTGVGKAVSGVVGTIWGDQSAKDAQRSGENMATYAQFASEFQVQNRTWFDSLIDGFNRLPRPVIVAMVITYFYFSFSDPLTFQQINEGLDTVPENMWIIAGSIVSFYFVARELSKSRDKKMALSKVEFEARMQRYDELEKRKRDRESVMEDEEFQAAMADTSKSLSNKAILEWNKRRR
tara:strand:+ start:1610 stop:2176 length:567 start_codon:yes stop_codon:yes gene_type:complete